MRLAHPCPPLSLVRYDAHVSCAHSCADVPLVPAGLLPRRDDFGYQLCELCPARLNRAKGKLHLHPPGKICQKCYDATRRPSSAAEAASTAQPSTPAPRSHKRKAGSDPGQQAMQQHHSCTRTITRRILPPTPTQQTLPRSMRSTEKIARQLEETHARRVAAMAAAASSASPPSQE